jgi:hypothetical protein
MGSLAARRRTVFAAALAALVAGAVAASLLGRPQSGAAPARSPHSAPAGREATVSRAAIGAAARSAHRFAVAYLRYEEGAFGLRERRAIALYSTSEFGGQLLRAPVRVPPGSHPSRQWVARVAAVRVGLFDGRPALVATLVIAATDGRHLLRATLTKRGSRWLVAGIGP